MSAVRNGHPAARLRGCQPACSRRQNHGRSHTTSARPLQQTRSEAGPSHVAAGSRAASVSRHDPEALMAAPVLGAICQADDGPINQPAHCSSRLSGWWGQFAGSPGARWHVHGLCTEYAQVRPRQGSNSDPQRKVAMCRDVQPSTVNAVPLCGHVVDFEVSGGGDHADAHKASQGESCSWHRARLQGRGR